MPKSPYLKAFVPVVLGTIGIAIQLVVTGTFSASEWSTLGFTVANALGVAAAPNTPAAGH